MQALKGVFLCVTGRNSEHETSERGEAAGVMFGQELIT